MKRKERFTMNNTKKVVVNNLSKELEKAYISLSRCTDQQEEDKIWDRISVLEYRLEQMESADKPKWYEKIDTNELIKSGIALTSILLILNYEKTEVITSKSLSIAQKLIGK